MLAVTPEFFGELPKGTSRVLECIGHVYTEKELFALSVTDLQKRIYTDVHGIRRYVCMPQAVKRAAELVAYFTDDQKGRATPLYRDLWQPTGWVRLYMGSKVTIDISGFGQYVITIQDLGKPVECRTLNQTLKVLGFGHD